MHFGSLAEVMSSLRKKGRKTHLLLGNGFSMAYDPNIFSYNALYDFINTLDDKVLSKLFGAIKSKNFEVIMQQLDTFLLILDAFDADPKLREQLNGASLKLKKSLLDAIKELHPAHVFQVPDEKSIACANFLRQFLEYGGHIFTTNYDLLLYWILMRQDVEHGDGCGYEVTNLSEVDAGEEPEFSSDLIWGENLYRQNVHYLHGALQFFDSGADIIKEQYDGTGYLLENISKRLDKGEYPIFVTAGNGEEKLAHIRHNQYLSYCYDHFSEMDGSLVTFGFGFGEYDEHIIEAINKAAHLGSNHQPQLKSVYIGTYSEKGLKHIEAITSKFRINQVHTFDASTANIWG
jgi:hypothetical protein